MSSSSSDNDPTVARPSSDPHATEHFDNSNVPDTEASAFSPGFVLAGKFRLEKQLGRGGMGEAWKAFDTLAERPVVLKFVPKEIQHVKEAMDSVKDSFKKVHALQHQHICPVYDLFQDEHHGLCLVMKYIDGMPLDEYRRKLIEKDKNLSFGDLVQILWGVAQGLDYAHEKKVVHRDIKPQNIMVGKTDGVQIIDFGLAEEIRTSMVRFSEVTMDVAGTRPYMAPEQWQGKYQDAATDQYALAVTAYQLFSGRVPFQGSDVGILRECVLHDPPDPIPSLPDYINTALLKALAKKREDRFENCKAFIRALAAKPKKKAVPPTIGDAAPPPADAAVSMPSINLKSEKQDGDASIWKPQISTAATDKPKKRRNFIPIYGAMGTVIVCLILGLVFAFSGKDDPRPDVADKPAPKPKATASGKKRETPAPIPAEPPQDLSVLSDAEKKTLQQKYPELDWTGANVVVLPEPSEDALRQALEKAAETPENDFIVVRTTKEKNKIVLDGGQILFNCDAGKNGAVTLIGLGSEKLVLDGNKKDRIFHIREGAKANFAGIVFTNGRVVDDTGGAIRVVINSVAGLFHCDLVDNACVPAKKFQWHEGFGGGGIMVWNSSTLILRDVLFEGNRIVDPETLKKPKTKGTKYSVDSFGALQFVGNCSFIATNVVFRKNYGGAVYAREMNEIDLRNISVVDNKMQGCGGVFHLQGQHARKTYKIANFFATGNTGSQLGGALYISGKGRYLLDHMTIVGNEAVDQAGGLCFGGGWDKIQATEITLSNSIVAGNESKHSSDFAVNGEKIDKLNILNCITSERNAEVRQRFSDGQNNRFLKLEDLNLGELQDFGNGVPVMPLLEGSPAIDAGVVTENTPKTDITGRPRNVGKSPDIGAFEWQGNSTPPPPTPLNDLSGLADDEKKSLQQKYPELDWTGANVVVLPEPSEDVLRQALEKAMETKENDFIVVRTTKEKHRIVLDNGAFEIRHHRRNNGSVSLISLGPEKLVLDGNKKDRILNIRDAARAYFAGIVFTNGFIVDGSGGAVKIVGHSGVRFYHCDLIGNVCKAVKKNAWWDGFGGGGICLDVGGLVLRDVLFEGNQLDFREVPKNKVPRHGSCSTGLFVLSDSTVKATNVVFRNNDGGAMFVNSMANIHMHNISVLDNKTSQGEIVHFRHHRKEMIFHVTNLFMAGNTVSDNEKDDSGTLVVSGNDGRFVLDHMTIVDNFNLATGSGLVISDNGNSKDIPSEVTLSNSIFAGNRRKGSDRDSNFEVKGKSQVEKLNIFNCITSDGPAEFGKDRNNLVVSRGDLKLGELTDFGNGVPVMPLLEGSPAINAGVVTENTPKADITDRPRIVGKSPDIGAFERQ